MKKYCWSSRKDGYIESRINGKLVLLHRFIYNSKNDVDHINRNRKDCRKSNLREATRHQNCMNKSIQKNNKSGYVGVSYDKKRKKWCSSITYKGTKIMKRFNTREEAIKQRTKWEKKYFNEFSPNYDDEY